AGQQRRLAQLRIGYAPGRPQQALRRVVDLVAKLALRGIHVITLRRPARPAAEDGWGRLGDTSVTGWPDGA
ncbi:MAG: hypothetical protein WB800_07535, partial [Streptosporangiaceae bacterium]